MLLLAGMPLFGTLNASAAPAPQQQSQTAATIEGTVLEENNEPVIGASVVQKGVSSNAVATDAFGHFKLRVAKGTLLEVSYVGYKTMTLKAADGMSIYLEPTTEMLNELVAIGYGTQKRANLTGAVATVDVSRTMENRPEQDVLKALQGAVPGLTVMNSTGNIDGTPSIKIRGTGTLSNKGNSNPLFVVDGVAMDDISFLNPDDIKEISVLKDASSSSIYGSRAAFGVLLITTKSGQKGERMQIKYSNNFGWGQASILPEIMDNVSSLEAMIEAAKRQGADQGEFFGMYYTDIPPYARKWQEQNSGKITDYRMARPYVDENNVGDYYLNPNGTGFLPYADYDINKIMLNNAAPSQQHNVSLSGSTGKAVYDLSFGYSERQSLVNFNPDKVRRYNAKANLSLDLFKWLQAGVRINFTKRHFETPNAGSNTWGTIWRFPSFYQMLGWRPDSEGTPYDFQNQIAYLKQADMEDINSTFTRLQAWAKATIIPGLTVNADFTYSIYNRNEEYAYLPVISWPSWGRTLSAPTYRVSQASTTATKANSVNNRWTFNAYATYDLTVADNNNFKLMLGTNIEQNTYGWFQARTKVLLDNNLPALNLYTGDLVAPGNEDNHWATAGFFGRFNYDYKGIYLAEFNGRYDGSSRFPANDQWAFFASGSIGYRFSEEAYFEPLKEWWSNGKIRASYGEIGNEAVGTNMFLSTVTTSNIDYLNHSTGILINAAGTPKLVSPSLTWERIRTIDAGIDLGFFNNSLTASFDWYQRDTRDMLAVGVQLPSVLGADTPYGNNGSLRTTGWELTLGWNKSFGDWDVYASFNIADARTKITKWNNPTRSLTDNYSGAEYGAIWGLDVARYYTVDDFVADPSQPDGIARNDKGQLITKPGVTNQWDIENNSFHYGPGDVMYVDRDGDGKISGGDGTEGNHGDLVKIGNSLPRYEYGFHLGGAWKGIDLDIFCQGVGQRDYWTVSSMVIPFTQAPNDIYYKGMDSHNSVILNDQYIITGYNVNQGNKYPTLYPGQMNANNVPGIENTGTNNFIPNSRYLQDLSYLRVKNITLGYTLPAEWTTKAYIQKARIYFSGENLFFIHRGNKGTGIDPEITTSEWIKNATTGDIYANAWGRANPIQRVYSFGIQVTF